VSNGLGRGETTAEEARKSDGEYKGTIPNIPADGVGRIKVSSPETLEGKPICGQR